MAVRVTNDVVVYRATNLVNGECYIGATRRGVEKREYEHKRHARRGSTAQPLYAAIREFGEDAFKFEVVFDFQDDYELALAYEAELVAKENPAYNVAPGGRKKSTIADPRRFDARCKAVKCLNDGRVFRSVTEAAAFYSLRPNHVAGVASGKGYRKSVHGLRFTYKVE